MTNKYTYENIQEISNHIASRTKIKPKIGIVLGSGLGALVSVVKDKQIIPYNTIKNFPISTVEGHSGCFVFGTIYNVPVVIMQGRFHYYEGYDMEDVVLPIKVMKLMGVDTLFVSNASGGLHPEFVTGDLMVITDHINFFPQNPLRGNNDERFGPRFPDMGSVYDKQLIEKAFTIAQRENIPLKKGIYIGSSGPTLETPAEYAMFRLLGADATGMSTVPEVIVAKHIGLRIFGISVITNESAKADIVETTHADVQKYASLSEPRMTTIFTKLIEVV